jgi:uncharacterized phage-like protein YoqJ
MIYAVTGHRLPKLGGYHPDARRRVLGFALEVIETLRQSEQPPDLIITGMALGWDMAVAKAAFIKGVPYVAAVPFWGQEKRWTVSDRLRYQVMLDHASEVVVVDGSRSAGMQDLDSAQIVARMYARNAYMVDRAEHLLALWDGSPGGTAHCVGYAQGVRRKPISYLWQAWEAFR